MKNKMGRGNASPFWFFSKKLLQFSAVAVKIIETLAKLQRRTFL
jgi:hypothetical protein